jgi:drug/metabolite transporter (DMT)-like permease
LEPLVTIPLRRDDSRFRCILLLIASMLFMVLCAVLTKHLRTEGYPTLQIVWARFVFHLALALLLTPRQWPGILRTQRPALQFTRAMLTLAGTVIFVIAVRYLPIAEIVAITFMAPILITLLAGSLLDERVGRRSWIALALSFLGMLAIIKPGMVSLHWAALLPLLLALCYAFNQVIIRMVGHVDSPMTTFAYVAAAGTLVSSVAAPFGWQTPDLIGWASLIGVGVLAGTAQLLLVYAYQRAAASALAPFLYTELIWAIVIGYAAFSEIPDSWTLAGAALIAGCGLYILQNERRPKAVI